MIILGLILPIAGFAAKITVLGPAGVAVLAAGLLPALPGAAGRAAGGRRHCW